MQKQKAQRCVTEPLEEAEKTVANVAGAVIGTGVLLGAAGAVGKIL